LRVLRLVRRLNRCKTRRKGYPDQPTPADVRERGNRGLRLERSVFVFFPIFTSRGRFFASRNQFSRTGIDFRVPEPIFASRSRFSRPGTDFRVPRLLAPTGENSGRASRHSFATPSRLKGSSFFLAFGCTRSLQKNEDGGRKSPDREKAAKRTPTPPKPRTDTLHPARARVFKRKIREARQGRLGGSRCVFLSLF
jgi:hypothetical protein